MKLKVKFMTVLLLVSVIFAGCNPSGQKEKIKNPEFMGYIENTQVNVTTRMPGRLTAIYVDEGDTLTKGEVVAQLDTREILANRSALISKLKNVEANKRRLENLYKAGAISQQKLDAITTGYDMLKDKIRALDTRIEDMTIKAPMDGIVNVKVLEINQMMPPGMPVVIETDPQGTWARFNIPETYLNQITLGKQFMLGSNVPGVQFQAKVVQILPMADFATHTPTTTRDEHDVRTFDVKMKITNQLSQCKPGMYVYLTLKAVSQPNSRNQQ